SFSVDAWAASPAVSKSFTTILTEPDVLAWSAASLTPLKMLIPRLALSPVSAPTKAIVAVFPPLDVLVLFLLLPHAAAIRPTAAMATSTRPLPRCALISVALPFGWLGSRRKCCTIAAPGADPNARPGFDQ